MAADDYDYAASLRERKANDDAVRNLKFPFAGPDETAQAIGLAKKTGLPPSVVVSAPEEAKARAADNEYSESLRGRPELATFLRSPEAAAMVQDDLENTRSFVDSLFAFHRAVPAGVLGDFPAAFMQSGAALMENLSNQPGAMGVRSIAEERELRTRLPDAPTGFYPDLAKDPLTEKTDQFKQRFRESYLKSKAEPLTPKYDPVAWAAKDLSKRAEKVKAFGDTVQGDMAGAGFIERSAVSGLRSMGTLAGGTIGTVITRNPVPLYTTMSAATFGPSYWEGRKSGLSPMASLTYGGVDTAIEHITERLPVGMLMKDLAKNAPLWKTLGRQLATEIPGEQAATILQDLNEWANVNPDKTAAQYLAERPGRAAETLIATITAVGAQTSLAHGVNKIVYGRQQQDEAARRAIAGADQLRQSADLLRATKLASRSPETAQALIETMSEKAGIDSVDIPVEEFRRFAQSQNLSEDELANELGAGEAFAESNLTGGDVRVPLSGFLPSKHANELSKKARLAGQNLSAEQAEEWLKGEGSKDLREEVSKLKSTVEKDDLQQEYNRIYSALSEYRPENEVRQLASLWTMGINAQAQSYYGGDIKAAIEGESFAVFGPDATPDTIARKFAQTSPDLANQSVDTIFNSFGNSPQAAAWMSMVDFPEAYQYPTSNATDIQTILKDVAGAEFQIGPIEPVNVRDGLTDYHIELSGINPKDGRAKSFAILVKEDDGNIQADLSSLSPGMGGAALYQAIAAYARARGKSFTEDNAGLSDHSVRRRVDHALSAASRFKNAYAMTPGPLMEQAEELYGAANVRFMDDPGLMIQEYMQALVKNMEEQSPETKGMRYNFKTGQFVDREGYEVPDADLRVISTKSGDGIVKPRLGITSLKRGIFTRSVLQTFEGMDVEDVKRLTKNSISGKVRAGLGRILYQNSEYYSNAMVVMGQKLPKSGTGTEIASLLERAAPQWGIKQDELEFSGVLDWLRGQESVTRQQVVAYMNENYVQIEEQNAYGAQNDFDPDVMDGALDSAYSDIARNASLWERLTLHVRTHRGGEVPRFNSFESVDHRQTFIEKMAIDHPWVEDFVHDIANKYAQDYRNENQEAQFSDMTLPGHGRKYENILFKVSGGKLASNLKTSSDHWDVNNVVSHARTEVRRDVETEEDIQIILEIQSDWHQHGSRHGYVGDPIDTSSWKATQDGLKDEQKTNGFWNVVGSDGKKVERLPVKAKTPELAIQKMVNRMAARQAPRGPFRANWQEMTVRRMINRAIRAGHSGIAWPSTAEQVAEIENWDGVHRRGQDWYAGEAPRMMEAREGLWVSIDPETNKIIYMGTKGNVPTGPQSEGGPNLIVREAVPGQDFWLMKPDNSVPVTGVINTYLRDIPKIASKWTKKYGVEIGPIKVTGDIDEPNILTGFRFTPEMKADAQKPQVLMQTDDRGASYFFTDGRRAMQLFESANSSTVIHEFGHLWLESLSRHAVRDNAPEQVKKDWATIKEWFTKQDPKEKLAELERMAANLEEKAKIEPSLLGQAINARESVEWLKANGGAELLQSEAGKWFQNVPDVYKDFIQVPYHELFARGTEAYMREGNAPSLELRDAFSRFILWLTRIYSDLRALRAPLNDDVRRVFDRLLATQDQIEMAKQASGLRNMFASAKDMGVSEKLFETYKAMGERAHREETERLQKELMDSLAREQTEAYKTAKEKVRNEVEEAAKEMPLYQAIAWIRSGKFIDGKEYGKVQHKKIDAEALARLYKTSDPDLYKKLSRMGLTTREGGLDPDEVADFFGFKSGDQMLRSIATSPKMSDWIDAEVERRMQEEYKDLMKSEADLAEAALAAVHRGETAAKVMKAELKAIRAKHRAESGARRVVREEEQEKEKEREYNRRWADAERNTRLDEERAARDAALDSDLPLDAVRAVARGIIGQKRVQDLRPFEYLKAERAASARAFERMAKKDYLVAAAEKQRQILNHYLYQEAIKAKSDVEKARAFAIRQSTKSAQEMLGKAQHSYLEQVNAILEQYEFKRVSDKALARRASLIEFVEEQKQLGHDLSIPESVLADARQTNYRQLSVDHLRDVHETLESLVHVARRWNKVYRNKRVQEFNEMRTELVGSLSSEFVRVTKKPLDEETLTWIDKLAQTRDEWDAMLLKPEQLFVWMDQGRADGPWQSLIFQPIADGQNLENQLTQDYTKKLSDIFRTYLDGRGKAMKEKIDLPEIGETVTRSGLLSFALNVGNEGNYQRLRDGYGWTDAQMQSVIDRLTPEDAVFIQSVWDLINGLWPQVSALQKRMTGIEPKKIEPREVKGKFGTMRGGYFPVMYDQDLSAVGEKQADDRADSVFNNLYLRATTSQGHTKARAEKFVGPLHLSLYNIPQHMSGVIHDLAFREPILQAERILNDKEIRKAITERVGIRYYRSLKTWVKGIANDRNLNRTATGTIEKLLQKSRMNLQVVALGLRFSTMFSQLGGYVQSLEEVSPKFVIGSMASFFNPMSAVRMTDYVRSRSQEMKFRGDALDRDMRDMVRKSISNKNWQTQIHMMAMKGIIFFDYLVTVPVWHAAYRESIAKGETEEYAARRADSVVRLTQGAGSAKDLANVQMGGEATKMLTLFYSYFSAYYARLRNTNQIRKVGRNNFVNIAWRTFILTAMSSIVGELLAGKGPDEDDDWASWAMWTTFMYPFASIPVLRDVINGVKSGFSPRTPIGSAIESVTKFTRASGKVMEDEKSVDTLIVPAIDMAGYLFGLPTGQIKITGGYLWDVMSGNEEPESVQDFLSGVLFKQE